MQDTTTPTAIVEQLNDPAIQLAVVANTASFVSAAQTSDSSVTNLTNAEYSDVETAKAIKAACDAVNWERALQNVILACDLRLSFCEMSCCDLA